MWEVWETYDALNVEAVAMSTSMGRGTAASLSNWEGVSTRSLYQYRLLLALCDELDFHFAQDCYWYNPGVIPASAEWVNVRLTGVSG